MKSFQKAFCALLFGLAGLGVAAILLVRYDFMSVLLGRRYCVIDLSGGPLATKWPVSYLSTMPEDGWTDTYKTTKLVLQRIPAGSFIMGVDQTNRNHRVTLTKPFYLGIFEVTQRQWELVMGSWPTSSPDSSRELDDTYPADCISYNDIRGSSLGARWPASSAVDASSFLGRLREKTGLDFDLPTEAQWEYACRAGTTTKYYWGDTKNGAYAWYSGSEAHPVGTRLPNAWGLYDMNGNGFEWCRDWFEEVLAYGTDPTGSASGSRRVVRGYSMFTSSSRFHFDPSDRVGFRLSRTLP